MQHSVVIIGGGPAGLSAALYLARANLSPIVLAGSPPGGQLMLTTEVENFPGAGSKMGPELVQSIRDQALHFGAQVIDTNVTKVTFGDTVHAVETEEAGEFQSLQSKSILIATGAKALWLGLESESRLRGRGVSACATCDGFFFRNKVVGIVGGGDTALEEALHLTKFASKVIVIARSGQFRASKIMQKRVLEHQKIEVVWNSRIKEVLGDQKVRGVLLESTTGSPEQRELALEGLFIAIGHKPDTALFSPQIAVDEKGYILTKAAIAERYLRGIAIPAPGDLDRYGSETYRASQTSKSGVFAAGDCVDAVYRQAATAAGMGVAASLDIERYLSD